jgi:AraC-like DNA-binding protein
MQSQIGRFSFNWLLTNGASTPPALDEGLSVRRADYPISPDLGAAFVEALHLSPGFCLYRAMHQLEHAPFGQMVPIADVSTRETDRIFSAQIWLSGIGCHQDYVQGRSAPPVELWGRPGQDTFRMNHAWDTKVLVAGGGVTEMRSVTVPHALLTALLGDSVFSQLLERLGLDAATTAVTHQIPQHLSAPLQDAMSDQFAGPARRLYAQAKALEYLGGLVDYFHVDNKKASSRRHTKKILELKEYLLLLEGRLPTLNQLATEFGLSAKQLNIEFKAEFGQAIFEYVAANRLEQARLAMLESRLPMKVIAERLGYSHVNHFITAFKRKFGYPPGSLRRI